MPKVTGKTYIDPETVLARVQRAGLTAEALASFYKVQGTGSRRIYIARTKGVGRIDLSGFRMPAKTAGIAELDKPFGGVSQQLEFDGRDEKQVLSTLDRVLASLKAAPRKGASKAPAKGKQASATA